MQFCRKLTPVGKSLLPRTAYALRHGFRANSAGVPASQALFSTSTARGAAARAEGRQKGGDKRRATTPLAPCTQHQLSPPLVSTPTFSFSTSAATTTTSAQPPPPPFDKILIANRGEIACRVIRTARRMGIKTVAIYSSIDDGALHVRMADEAVCVGPAPALQSYLDMDKVMDAIVSTGAQAVHPGYGFLSENMAFSAACEKEGVKFIGPPASAIRDMGDKIASKIIAHDAGVHTIPGYKGEIRDMEEAVRIANEVGYPVMMKASAGGGGKGMRVAFNDDEVREGFEVSKREAMSSFNDDRMLVERFVEDGHHIEIQVVADSHGNVAAFPERECSVQRRHQKVLEESPSVLLDDKTRREMQRQAILLSKAVGYRSAGTVEMLCDNDLNFYFLEMNTRLQVEHPITEMITGFDLVEEMINIAAGRPMSPSLAAGQESVPFVGHALESRVYAEDPIRNFLPSSGPLVDYIEPPLDEFSDAGEKCPPTRVDTGVLEGSSISMFYDPLIAKLTTFGKDRTNAIHRMRHALDSYVISGLGHNAAFLRDVCRNKDFVEGKYSTSFIEKEYPDGFHGVTLSETETLDMVSVAAVIHKIRLMRDDSTTGQVPAFVPASHNEHVVVLGGPKGEAYHTVISEQYSGEENAWDTSVCVTPMGEDGQLILSRQQELELEDVEWPMEGKLFLSEINGRPRVVQYHGSRGEGHDLIMCGAVHHVAVRTPREHSLSMHMLPPVVEDHSKVLRCPMPGKVISVAVTEGESVEDGQELAVVEAMKMQNVLRAQQRGRVDKVRCKAGDTLKVDAVMIEFDFHHEED